MNAQQVSVGSGSWGTSAGSSTTVPSYTIFVGDNAGTSGSNSGTYNSFVGDHAGRNNTTGSYNSFFGSFSGFNNISGSYNCYFGWNTGLNASGCIGNSFFGSAAGQNTTTGQFNTFLGDATGLNNTTGANNVYLGIGSGLMNQSGNNNSFLGGYSGKYTLVDNNVFIGYNSGFTNTLGTQNTFVGVSSGYYFDHVGTTTGYNNTLVGYQAGYGSASSTTGYYNTFIGHSSGLGITSGYNNTFLGYYSGALNTSGIENTFLGTSSGANFTGSTANYNTCVGVNSGLGFHTASGKENTFIGHSAGASITTGNENTCLGKGTGQSLNGGSYNTFIGFESGNKNTTQSIPGWNGDQIGNTFTGYHSGFSNISGDANVFSGRDAGYSNTTGTNNCFFGYEAGNKNTVGAQNTMIGDNAGNNGRSAGTTVGGIYTTEQNIFLGSGSGQFYNGVRNTFLGAVTLSLGDDNVLIGNGATGGTSTTLTTIGATPPTCGTVNASVAIGAQSSVTASNTIVLGSTKPGYMVTVVIGATAPSSSYGTLWGSGGTSSTGPYKLEVNGDAWISNAWYASDQRFKKNIEKMANARDIIRQLNPVKYEYRDDLYFPKTSEKSDPVKMNFSKGQQIGFLAQELQKQIPQAVMDRGDGYLAVNYNDLFGVVVQGMKEQDSDIVNLNTKIDSISKQNISLVSIIESLTSRLSALEQAMKMTSGNTSITNGSSINASSKQAYMEQNSPNPFSENTLVKYFIPENINTAKVAVISSDNAHEIVSFTINQKGSGNLIISGNTLTPGNYILQLIVDGMVVDTKKMLLIR